MSSTTKRFVWHYIEMVAVMFVGMGVLMLPTGVALEAAGSSWTQLGDDAPALMFLLMATTMTVPMVGWMAYRGHGWRPNAEMAGSMIVPTFVVIALMGAGVVTDVSTLLVAEHVAMPLCMLGAMLLRPAEYSCAHVRGTRRRPAVVRGPR